MALDLDQLIKAGSELTHQPSSSVPVVLMTRIRLARNIAGYPFPGFASEEDRENVFRQVVEAARGQDLLGDPLVLRIADLSEREKRILVERHLISRELAEAEAGAGVILNADQSCSIMVNEEDHLRMQAMLAGFQLEKVWKRIDELDSGLEGRLEYAFSPDLGYLTACPSNVGTGLRASVMMHLPGLVIAKSMEKVIRAVNQIGLVVRGWFGEGSDASGSIFQISNQQTLGESEAAILKRLGNVLKTVRKQEENARLRLLESDRNRILDRIGRAYGSLRHSHLLSSNEGMSVLSLIRMGVDFGIFPKEVRSRVDRLFIETQPAHVQHLASSELESAARDSLRANLLREEFASLPEPDWEKAPS